MYAYSAVDQRIIEERVTQFRDQTARYLRGELSESQFLPLRLQNGLYRQRLAPMLRIAVPYGLLSSKQLRAIARISRDYDKGYAHVSTRQNLQLNWPRLEDVPDLLAPISRRCRCTRSRPAATASATPRRTPLPASPSTRSRIPAPGAN
jgi:sulfite reductase (NADPH) hemoprotein beta-component